MNGWLLVLAEHAAEAGGEAHAQPSLFAGDIGNFIWTLVIFLILLIVLGKFAWKPILKALQDREKFITDSLATAKKERDDAARMLAEYQAKIDHAREEATAIVEEGKRDAEAVRKRIHGEARGEADAMIARAKREIEIARDDALKALYDQSVMLATTMAGKIVRKQLNAGDHRQLIDESLAEMGRRVG